MLLSRQILLDLALSSIRFKTLVAGCDGIQKRFKRWRCVELEPNKGRTERRLQGFQFIQATWATVLGGSGLDFSRQPRTGSDASLETDLAGSCSF